MSTNTQPDLGNDDFGAVLNCAIRYCLGRQTYMPHLVMDHITPLLPSLSRRTLACFERDIRDAVEYGLGHPDIDKPRWMTFLKDVQAELERRETHVSAQSGERTTADVY